MSAGVFCRMIEYLIFPSSAFEALEYMSFYSIPFVVEVFEDSIIS